jgi:hypothetical protein
MARLGWVCEDCGLVSANGVHRYSLTAKGLAVLGDWERLMAHDGEPSAGCAVALERMVDTGQFMELDDEDPFAVAGGGK